MRENIILNSLIRLRNLTEGGRRIMAYYITVKKVWYSAIWSEKIRKRAGNARKKDSALSTVLNLY